MRLKPSSDFWKVGIVPAPAEALLDAETLADCAGRIRWLPDPGPWRYLADPFAVKKGDTLHVFVEAYDYRTKHGFIERHEVGPDLEWRGKAVALTRPFHLSYPFLLEQHGEVLMVPESHMAGEIALYRAHAFPDRWVREAVLLADVPAAEACLIQHQETWWMFYTIVGIGARDQRELHVAFSERLTGPWKTHPGNPVLVDRAGARPGGTPFLSADDKIVLPVQDCSVSYGGSIRFLQFDELSQTRIACQHLPQRLTGDLAAADHAAGLHTFTICGDVTLIDVKRVSRSFARHIVNLQRRAGSIRKTTFSQ
ncbi:glucosamine inositolphosphorylceramide transferase family protein [Rhizobium tropici]|uniref:Glycosyl hydrolase family 43 n=1 Tax=Rhizobium tropici TaxID=398 RepID=A0A329Y7B1_RHITR|nr:glycosyl hydrolase family 43 [Rhizobium tropici]RAX37924.1 glycosyl hydrolase family 43 [Rhizobium tropici]